MLQHVSSIPRVSAGSSFRSLDIAANSSLMKTFEVPRNNAPWSKHEMCSWALPEKVCDSRCTHFVTFCHNNNKPRGCRKPVQDGACDKGWHYRGPVTMCPRIKLAGTCSFGCTPTWTMCHDKIMGTCVEQGHNCPQGWHVPKKAYLEILAQRPAIEIQKSQPTNV